MVEQEIIRDNAHENGWLTQARMGSKLKQQGDSMPEQILEENLTQQVSQERRVPLVELKQLQTLLKQMEHSNNPVLRDKATKARKELDSKQSMQDVEDGFIAHLFKALVQFLIKMLKEDNPEFTESRHNIDPIQQLLLEESKREGRGQDLARELHELDEEFFTELFKKEAGREPNERELQKIKEGKYRGPITGGSGEDESTVATGVRDENLVKAFKGNPRLEAYLEQLGLAQDVGVLSPDMVDQVITDLRHDIVGGVIGAKEAQDAMVELLKLEKRLELKKDSSHTNKELHKMHASMRERMEKLSTAEGRVRKETLINQELSDYADKVLTGDIDNANPEAQAYYQFLSGEQQRLAHEEQRARYSRGEQQGLTPEQILDMNGTIEDYIDRRITKIQTTDTSADDARAHYNEMRRYINIVVKNADDGNLQMDRQTRERLRELGSDTTGNNLNLDLDNYKELAKELDELKVAELFKDMHQQGGAGENFPSSLERLMQLIMVNSGAEYRVGGEKQLLNAQNEVQYHNYLDWVRNRIIEAQDGNPDDEINPLSGVTVTGVYSPISLQDMVFNDRYGITEEIVLEGKAWGDKPLNRWFNRKKDVTWSEYKWTVLTEGWLFGLNHNYDTIYRKFRGNEDALYKALAEQIYGKNVFTKDNRLFKILSLAGNSEEEWKNYVESKEQGKVGKAIQVMLAAYNNLSEITIEDNSQLEGGENMFKKALGGDEGMKIFWQSMAADVMQSTGKDFVSKYIDFAQEIMHGERQRLLNEYGSEKYAQIADIVEDNLADFDRKIAKEDDRKKFNIRFNEISELYNLRIKVEQKLKGAPLTQKEKDKVREETSSHISSRVKEGYILKLAGTEIAQEKGITEDMLAQFDVNDENFSLEILKQLKGIKREHLNIFSSQYEPYDMVSLIKKGITNAACKQLNLQPTEVRYAEMWGYNFVNWTGMAAKQDTNVAGFDALSKIFNMKWYREKQWKNTIPGNKQNIPMLKHMGLSFFDWLTVSEAGKEAYNRSFMDIVQGEQGKIGDIHNKERKFSANDYSFQGSQETHYGQVYIQSAHQLYELLTDPEKMYFNFEKGLRYDSHMHVIADPNWEKFFWGTYLKAIRYLEHTPMNYNNNIRTWKIEHGKVIYETVKRENHMFGEEVLTMGMKDIEKDKLAKSVFAALIAADLRERNVHDKTIQRYSYDMVNLIERYFLVRKTQLEEHTHYLINGNIVTKEKYDAEPDPKNKSIIQEVVSDTPYFNKEQIKEIKTHGLARYKEMQMGYDLANVGGSLALGFFSGIKEFFKQLAAS